MNARRAPVASAAVVLCTAAGCAGAPTGAPAHSAPPVGAWALVGFGPDRPAVAGATLDVAADGTLSGNGGCNRWFGRWTVEDGRVLIGPIGATRRACEGPLMDLESDYFAALPDVAGWRGDASAIELVGPSGRTLLRFKASR